MTAPRSKHILVAGIGNLFMRDDGFGAEVARRLTARPLGPGVEVFEFGTGGLKLAYEVMRGYDALILVDVSKRGGAPGTLYVLDVDPDSVPGDIADGEVLDPHGMDPTSVLRFVKAVGGWPGQVMVVACEPGDVEDMGIGLTPEVSAAADRAVELIVSTIDELQTTKA